MSTRAERRRAERGIPEHAVAGKLGCKFCMTTKGTFEKRGNRFVCETLGCRGSKTTHQLFDEEFGGKL